MADPKDVENDITVLPDGLHVTAVGEETLLKALGRAGLRYRVGCKRGGCGVCKLHLLAGEVRYERPVADSVLTDDELRAGLLASSRHRASGFSMDRLADRYLGIFEQVSAPRRRSPGWVRRRAGAPKVRHVRPANVPRSRERTRSL